MINLHFPLNTIPDENFYNESSASQCMASSNAVLFPIIEWESQDEERNCKRLWRKNCQIAMGDELSTTLIRKPLVRSKTVTCDLSSLGQERSNCSSPSRQELTDGKKDIEAMRQQQQEEPHEDNGPRNETCETNLSVYSMLQVSHSAIVEHPHVEIVVSEEYSVQDDNLWGQFVTPEPSRQLLRPSSALACRIHRRTARSTSAPCAVEC